MKYNIEFKGLKEGLHDFEFEIDKLFFVHFEESPVKNGELVVKVTLEKRSSFLKLYLNIEGWLELTCDRCLEIYQQPVENETEVFVKYGEGEDDEGENIIWVDPEEHHVNLSQIIYEYIVLAIPMRSVHPKNSDGKRGCNREMIEKLKKYKLSKKENEIKTDPRWDALRRLENNN
jgi:uncharacterized metal-binding protein YceD (DUF177 family)